MPTQKDPLADQLSRYREIKITVTGRKSGRAISKPVWFVWEDNKLNLLPVYGSDTPWYKNVLENPAVRVAARDAKGEFKALPVTDAKQVASVVDKFRAKYGAGDVKKILLKVRRCRFRRTILSPRPCNSRGHKHRHTKHREKSQQLQVIRRVRPTERHIRGYQNRLLVVRRIVMHHNRRSLGMLIRPILHSVELARRILPDHSSRGGRAVRVNVRRNLLTANGVSDAAIDPVSLRFVRVDIDTASLYARRHLRPLRVGMFHPSVCCSYHQRKHRTQPCGQPHKREH
jgi:deazaflavin-dependent oxidoreductase (nitroreductase family)